MVLNFHISNQSYSSLRQARNTAILNVDNWDDFGFKSLFHLSIFDDNGVNHEIGSVKIGYVGQQEGWLEGGIPAQFESLDENFFSLGQDSDYYRNIKKKLSPELAENLLSSLGDIVNDSDRFGRAKNEQVFNTSLLRSVSLSAIDNQYKRILEGGAPLTEYRFCYEKEPSNDYSGFKLDFHIKPDSKPSTNIHVLIGRNGVGKTTLLDNMVGAILSNQQDNGEAGEFTNREGMSQFVPTALPDNYFSGVVSVSFSAFDPFVPPPTQNDRSLGTCYFYVGLKEIFDQNGGRVNRLKEPSELGADFIDSVKVCLGLHEKRERWLNSVRKLETDDNFAEMNLCQLADIAAGDQFDHRAASIFSRMSSGHAIVLLSITKLVETVEEKTLVLMDEPESHLHPPLLSAFTRALSDLLINRNGVAIIATHSPVVLQEVPRSCVSILRRTRLVGNVDRPEGETFAENVGVLTREVFGLEVSKSGFHELLTKSVREGLSYEEIEESYDYQLGFEGRIILRALILERDSLDGDVL